MEATQMKKKRMREEKEERGKRTRKKSYLTFLQNKIKSSNRHEKNNAALVVSSIAFHLIVDQVRQSKQEGKETYIFQEQYYCFT